MPKTTAEATKAVSEFCLSHPMLDPREPIPEWIYNEQPPPTDSKPTLFTAASTPASKTAGPSARRKKRSPDFQTAGEFNQLIISYDPNHSAYTLCESLTSQGPDLVSRDEQSQLILCDMTSKTAAVLTPDKTIDILEAVKRVTGRTYEGGLEIWGDEPQQGLEKRQGEWGHCTWFNCLYHDPFPNCKGCLPKDWSGNRTVKNFPPHSEQCQPECLDCHKTCHDWCWGHGKACDEQKKKEAEEEKKKQDQLTDVITAISNSQHLPPPHKNPFDLTPEETAARDRDCDFIPFCPRGPRCGNCNDDKVVRYGTEGCETLCKRCQVECIDGCTLFGAACQRGWLGWGRWGGWD